MAVGGSKEEEKKEEHHAPYVPTPKPEMTVGRVMIGLELVNGVNVFDSAIETHETSNGDDRGLRLEHLARNDGRQNCKACELYMRNIAIKLHSVGLPNVNGFSTTN